MARRPARPRCERCGELLTSDSKLCARCQAAPASPGLPARFARYDPARRNPVYHFFHGIGFFLAAIPYALTTGGIKRYVAAPIALTLVVLVALTGGAIWLVWWLLGSPEPGTIAAAGATAVEIVIVGAILVGAYLLFFPLARLLLAPFADKISERVEVLAYGEPPPSEFDVARAATDTARSVVEALKMLSFELVITLPLLLVPIAGPVLALVAGVFFNGIGALDIAMGRKRLRFGQKLRLGVRNLGFVLGLGTAIYLVLLVPVLNLLAIPLGAIAATAGFLRIAATGDVPGQ